ncbi:MAG: nitroreductase family protein [Sedimentisphaerales bacterium]|jgi:nitroreductase|nr:nitroreductase family protein [Sedimentisphaerales bacterium]NLZ04076.1 nitroreductase [Phycisphaerae bacterium]HNY78175.1 nitroreductase family protein [Sedimentisphaerales bacterium]HOC65400.1 nitroreductase family protein [Sedimentisphaerales bacterium]HOH63213.1 nitroreductase family protein [Sedimentisphaerales bacterium]
MDVSEAIRRRYSCRSYADRPLEKERLDMILEAARQAPSAKNLQDWRFVVVTDKATKKKLAVAANGQTFIENAGAIIVACTTSDHVMRCGQAIGPIDVSIALEHMCLQATELGLATCWIGSFYADKVRAVVGVPEEVEIIELLALGHPADSPKEHRREPIESIVSLEKWRF